MDTGEPGQVLNTFVSLLDSLNSFTQTMNYCPTCDETCESHPEICTICGDTLISTPQSNTTRNNHGNRNVQFQQLPTGAGAGTSTGASTSFSGIIGNNVNADEEWEIPTEEAMNPQQAKSKSYPTSKECLSKIPRITIDEHSAILYEASIQVQIQSHSQTQKQTPESNNENQIHSFNATIGEFPPHPPLNICGTLELSEPIHGSLPIHYRRNRIECTSESQSQFESKSKSKSKSNNPILLMERGGNLTFVQKAQNAKSVGAQAVICANNVPVWPYIMKDSSNKARQDDVPIVMVKRSDGNTLKQLLTRSRARKQQAQSKSGTSNSNEETINIKIEAKKSVNSCIICTEGFHVGSTVMRLPLCTHVFHETCALSWLTKHNTCPYCRRELPAEDEAYEVERRRTGRTHRASADSQNDGLSEDQWETIFG